MANILYRPFIETLLAPGNAANGHGGLTIDLLSASGTAERAVALVDDVGGYSFSVDHQWVDDLGANIVDDGGGSGSGDQGEIENMVFVDSSNGVAVDGDDVTMNGVGDGNETVNVIVIYDKVDDSADQNPLIAHIDTGTGFDFTPNGSIVLITWDSGANRIFSIGV